MLWICECAAPGQPSGFARWTFLGCDCSMSFSLVKVDHIKSSPAWMIGTGLFNMSVDIKLVLTARSCDGCKQTSRQTWLSALTWGARLSGLLASPPHKPITTRELTTTKNFNLNHNHGDRVDRAIGARVPKTASHLRQLEA